MWWNGTSPFEFDRKSMETETITLSEFLNGGKEIIEQILTSEESKLHNWVSYIAKMSGEFDSRKDSHSTRSEWIPWRLVKLCQGLF